MALAVKTLLDWERRQLDVEMTFLEADVTEDLYVELPDEYRDSPNQVGRLQKAMYGLMRAGLLWSKTFGGELIAKGFERSQADPCVFRREYLGKVVVIILVYVDDLLVLSKTKQDEHQALEDLRSSFPMQGSRRGLVLPGMTHYSGPPGEDGDVRSTALRADGNRAIRNSEDQRNPCSYGESASFEGRRAAKRP